jgi:hypothetical protein
MLQLYLLSVCCDVLAGFILVNNFTSDSVGGAENSPFALQIDVFRFALGIVAILTGLLVLISPIEGSPPFAGDLVPALAALLCGAILVYEFYFTDSGEAPSGIGAVAYILRANKKGIGYICILAGILHFLFPRALFI